MRRAWTPYVGSLLFIVGGVYLIVQGRSTLVAGVLILFMGLFTLGTTLWQFLARRRTDRGDLPKGLRPESIAAIKRDRKFRRDQQELQETLADIGARYDKLRAESDYAAPAANALLASCYTAMRQAEALKPLWLRYGITVNYCSAYKANAVICEKRGEYLYAAQVCVRAIRAGFPDDGRENGMYRRLRHLLDFGGFEPDAEMRELAEHE